MKITSLIQHVLSSYPTSASVGDIHAMCERASGKALNGDTIRRELCRLTNEKSFKNNWIERVSPGMYRYVNRVSKSIENFDPRPNATFKARIVNDDSVHAEIEIPSHIKHVRLSINKI